MYLHDIIYMYIEKYNLFTENVIISFYFCCLYTIL